MCGSLRRLRALPHQPRTQPGTRQVELRAADWQHKCGSTRGATVWSCVLLSANRLPQAPPQRGRAARPVWGQQGSKEAEGAGEGGGLPRAGRGAEAPPGQHVAEGRELAACAGQEVRAPGVCPYVGANVCTPSALSVCVCQDLEEGQGAVYRPEGASTCSLEKATLAP